MNGRNVAVTEEDPLGAVLALEDTTDPVASAPAYAAALRRLADGLGGTDGADLQAGLTSWLLDALRLAPPAGEEWASWQEAAGTRRWISGRPRRAGGRLLPPHRRSRARASPAPPASSPCCAPRSSGAPGTRCAGSGPPGRRADDALGLSGTVDPSRAASPAWWWRGSTPELGARPMSRPPSTGE
ncbi:MAG: hypothetical protein R3F43_03980 [bacterium]